MNDIDDGGRQQQQQQQQQQQRRLIERFRSAIMACFENYQTDLRRPNPVHYYNNTLRLLFNDLYDMVVQITKLSSIDKDPIDYIYDIYSECATKAFGKFAENLEHDLQSTSNCKPTVWKFGSYQSRNQSTINIAKILIEFWSQFKRNVLPFLLATFQYVERRRRKRQQQQQQKQQRYRRMMLEELTRTIFIEIFFEQSSSIITQYWRPLIIDYLLEKHRQIQQYLWCRKPSERLPLETDSLIRWPSFQHNRVIKMLQDEHYIVIKNLIQTLLDVGFDQATYYKVFLIPFLEEDLEAFLVQMSNHLMNELAPLEYLNFLMNFIQMQSWFINSVLILPEESLQQINLFTIEFLLINNANRLIIGNNNENDGSFKSMLNHKFYDRMTQFYSLMMNITAEKFLISKQNILINQFIDFLIKYHGERINWFTNQYRCVSRFEAIEFVQALLHEHDHWDHVLNKVFNIKETNDITDNNGKRTNKSLAMKKKPFSKLIDKYHYELMKIDTNVSQALAFYMHDLLCKDSIIMSLQTIISVEFETRIELLNRINFIIVYIKDINLFFDFTKHYFTQRMLTNLSYFSNDQEMDMMNDMNHVIRLNFMSMKGDGQSRSFLQNLNDFKNIANDYVHSFVKVNMNNNNNNNRRRRMIRNFLESSAILNAGTWKLTEFDHCWIPSRLSRSFESLEYLFRQQYENQKLFLNTKYSTAEVSMITLDRSNNNNNNHDNDSLLKQPVTLLMSLHQLAVIEQFNRRNQQLSFEMIVDETHFQKENNLRIALLSLIYCGLIRPIIINNDNHRNMQQSSKKPTLESLLFELNDEKRFRQLIDTNQCSNRLIAYEYIDFINVKQQPLDKEMVKIFPIIVQLLTDGVDLVYSMSASSVEDWNLTNILSSCTKTTSTTTTSSSSSAAAATVEPPTPNSSVESAKYRQLLSSSSTRLSNQNSTPSPARTSSSTSVIESPNHLDSSIKIDAAIVRVLKRLRYLPNISSVYHAVRLEMTNASRKHLPPTPSISNLHKSTPSLLNRNHKSTPPSTQQSSSPSQNNISLNDIQTRLIQLIDKRYIRRNTDGGFEYNIE
ncbi:hypothetical protein DERP_007153 [Dermatophagoides pteronyssinus]|uniref:Cullin family profile domain-containing protein n=1 Tax=Dermatophagoides pteronyssinus TaxID=6956 RepID=A0ABQ8JUX6_DERPT|nr:hypothetical protein DERP_007153 [Dermatophagoides pteronyssinus]